MFHHLPGRVLKLVHGEAEKPEGDRPQRKRDQRHLPTQAEQIEQRGNQDEDVEDRRQHNLGDQFLDVLRFIEYALHQRARLSTGEKIQRQSLQMVVDFRLNLNDNLLLEV